MPFPLSSKYDKDWIQENSLGDNPLYLAESLSQVIEFKPGMRVLELGCGKAVASIFLAKEFGVQVFAVDRLVNANENFERIKHNDCENLVIPIKADVRYLPFAKNYFDIIFSANAYLYFGTDERFLPYIVQYLKPDGVIGIVDTCFQKEIENPANVPKFLYQSFLSHWYYVHSLEWWKNHWARTGLVEITHAEIIKESALVKKEMLENYKTMESEKEIIEFIENDKDNFINTFRLVGKRESKQIFMEEDEGRI